MNKTRLSILFAKKTLSRKPPLPFLSSFPLFPTSFPKYFASFSHSGGHHHHPQINSLITKQDSSLVSSIGLDDGESIEDRFHLSQICDVKKVFSILRQKNNKFSLNDLTHFLRRIAEINEEKCLQLSPKNSTELNNFIQDIKRNLVNSTQEYPNIGSCAWCFWKLNHQEDHDLWLTLADHIIDDRFFPSFHETMCGIEGFIALNGIADQAFIDQVYQKLEKILMLTIIEVNSNHFKRIAEGLVQANRFTDEVFNSIESHFRHFLVTHDLEYDLDLMLDVLACFAISGNGSEEFFYLFQKLFIQWNGEEKEHKEETREKQGSFLSKLVQTFALARMRQPDMVLEEEFKGLAQKLLVDEEVEYNLQELVNVIQYIWTFDFKGPERVYEALDKKLFEVKGYMSCEDMIRYIDLKVQRDHEEEYSKLSKDVLNFFDGYLNENMEKQSPVQIYNYVSEMENRDLMKDKGKLLNQVILYVGKRLHVYDFEDLCYFFYIFNKHHDLIQKDSTKVQDYLNQIKDNIRLTSAFSKGRLGIESNFYKMLEFVNGPDFLTEGEYPAW